MALGGGGHRRITGRCRFSFVLLANLLVCNIAGEAKSAANSTVKQLTPADLLTVVSVSSPKQLKGPYAGYLATFSELSLGQHEYIAWAPPGDDLLGCAALPSLPLPPRGRGQEVALLLRRGNCTFEEKAIRAKAAGAAALLIIGTGEEALIMGGDNATTGNASIRIPVVGMQKSIGDKMIDWVHSHPRFNDPITFTLVHYAPSVWNVYISELVIIVGATVLVVAGACFATSDLRQGSPLAPKSREEVVDVNNELAVSFCFMGSIMLVVLFFFMKYLIYFIMFGFCVGGLSCIQQITSACLSYVFPQIRPPVYTIPVFQERISVADMIATVPAIAVVACWILFRNDSIGWIFQDIIGAGFLCWIQRTLRLPNIKVATVLLSAMFFFDIFWVFLSPLLFKKSVMVEVATGGGTGEKVPMLLRVPSVGDMLGGERMLGFGDVALPGLLVSYLRRHDILSKRHCCRGYFVPSVVGYFLGLCVTIVALTVMKMGQPALLYLVPGTLGTTLVLGCCRGELNQLWSGKPTVFQEDGTPSESGSVFDEKSEDDEEQA